MFRRVLCLCLAGQLAAWPLAGQEAVSDPEVAKGIVQVDDGDYDAAILTLDAAARRLSGQSGRAKDLAHAYLYLGVAYLAKGHETAARARFREALAQVGDLRPSPEKFSPKVIEHFERAKQESAQVAPPPAAKPAAAAAPARKGGSKKRLIFLGVGALAAAGIAAGAGGSKEAAAPAQRRTESFPGNLGGNENLTFPIDVAAAGVLEATLTWSEPEARLAMDLHVPGSIAATSGLTSPTRATLTANVTRQTYQLQVLHRGGCGDEPSASSSSTAWRTSARPCSTQFNLTVIHP